MQNNSRRALWIKLALAVVIFMAMPFAAPMMLEVVFMLDILGLEALVLYLLYQARDQFTILHYFFRSRMRVWLLCLSAMLLMLGNLYMLQADVALAHLLASVLLLALAGSLVMALALWLPPLLLSSERYRPAFALARHPALVRRPRVR